MQPVPEYYHTGLIRRGHRTRQRPSNASSWFVSFQSIFHRINSWIAIGFDGPQLFHTTHLDTGDVQISNPRVASNSEHECLGVWAARNASQPPVNCVKLLCELGLLRAELEGKEFGAGRHHVRGARLTWLVGEP